MNNNPTEILELFKMLNSDVQKSIEKLNDKNNDFDFYSRAYLRAFATLIEGSIWMYKEVVRKNEGQWHKELPLESQLYLFEYDWRIKNSGETYLQSKKIKTKENLKGLFYVMSQLFQDFYVEIDGTGWNDITFFYQVRDKMMHPSSVDSLIITRADIKQCDRGRIWLKDVFQKLNDHIINKTNT